MIHLQLLETSTTRQSWLDDWRLNQHQYKAQYVNGQTSFVANLLPELAVRLDVFQVFGLLAQKLGPDVLAQALNPYHTIPSSVVQQPDSLWLKKSNMVGVNIRTIGSFWNVVKYALTLPQSHDSIHLLPIWEPGVVGSLYGKVSWNINQEFFSPELARAVPSLDTVERQLKVVVNLLHAMGKSVGLDVIPHTDRFSEIVIIHPRIFEWVRREGSQITDHSQNVWQDVEKAIWQWLRKNGTADGSSPDFEPDALFDPANKTLTDNQRQAMIFGAGWDQQLRLKRRIWLIQFLVYEGFETLPMTMAPPYRGLHINPKVFTVDERGTRWYQYDFDKPQAMSRVFGPLTRYRFFDSKNNNKNWELDFDKPNMPAWDYFRRKYLECQQQYNFDFMRGDMAHVQMQPDGVPAQPTIFYDPLKATKKYIQDHGTPHFAFYAETFLAPPDVMGYGNELDHLEAIDADVSLGDLQSSVVASEVFMERFADYDNYCKTRQFAPSWTVITADKDDPRFDEFYRHGNSARYFIALFLTDMPSYYSLGFEVRGQNLERNKNESYTKLYVFKITDDSETDKVTHGPFEWGINGTHFDSMNRLRFFGESIWATIANKPTQWLLAPDRTAQCKLVVWTQANSPEYIFIVNLSATDIETLPNNIWKQTKDYSVVYDSQSATNHIFSTKISPGQALVLRVN
jgi:hypothetical protein